jgi:hypothetical protein
VGSSEKFSVEKLKGLDCRGEYAHKVKMFLK